MVNKFSHQQKLSQKMALTPQMRHSIQLLGMSTKDLNEYINSAVEVNPFLKKALDGNRDRYKSSLSQANNSNNYYEHNGDTNQQDEDARLSLLSQLRILDLSSKELEIAESLIYEMDDNGYVAVALEEVAQDLSVSIDEAENVLEIIQGLEPPGIGARDVRECLQLQLERANKKDSLEYTIVSEFINELAKEDIAKLSKALKVDKEKIKTAINNIKKLNPRPASTMFSKKPEHVIPDLVAIVKDNKMRLEINREWLPNLRLYNPYENKLDIIKDAEARKFMKENMDSARHLIDGLKRREETMCKVADFILNFHGNESINGKSEMKSLTIKEISASLNLHPSTINRTVANKYIQIDSNVVPLKSLLSHGIKKENGEVMSKTSVKKRIEELIRNEDKSRPLTDKVIHEKLAQDGIVIKRRTIAKYRNSLRILPSYLRKKIA